MSEDTEKELQEHILECSQNYGDLKNQVALQNQKIDTLGDKVHEIYNFIKNVVIYLLVAAASGVWWFFEHVVLKQ